MSRKNTTSNLSLLSSLFSENTSLLVVTWLGLLAILLALANYVDRTGTAPFSPPVNAQSSSY